MDREIQIELMRTAEERANKGLFERMRSAAYQAFLRRFDHHARESVDEEVYERMA